MKNIEGKTPLFDETMHRVKLIKIVFLKSHQLRIFSPLSALNSDDISARAELQKLVLRIAEC